MKRLLFILLVTLNSCFLFGKDSTRLDSKISFDLKGQHVLSALNTNTQCYNCIFTRVQDNPFHHFAIYSGITHELTLNNKYTIQTGVYLEERSFSGGNNTLANIVIFPKIQLSSIDTIHIFKKDIITTIKGGDFWNEDVNDMLRIYNLDYQGFNLQTGTERLKIDLFAIADLSQNIGYALHELYRVSLIYTSDGYKNSTSISANKLFYNRDGSTHPTSSDFNVSNYSKYSLGKKTTAELQFETRINQVTGLSTAVGGRLNYSSKHLKLIGGIRYYDAGFNLGYANRTPQFGGIFTYTGRQLYPLKNYYRNYNQWASFTQFQNRNLVGIELVINWDKQVYKNIEFFADIDLNIIGDLSNNRTFTYPLYNTGFKLKLINSMEIFASATNKHMNLTDFYQTFFASKTPFLSYGVKVNLDKIKLRTMYIKS
ncbi:MAG: hypothetical protein COA58_05060 [Bacteroidetes bacterium]|nr:MAG: hypothetical protein COA58_05060 [Bacteroidota bacterium]